MVTLDPVAQIISYKWSPVGLSILAIGRLSIYALNILLNFQKSRIDQILQHSILDYGEANILLGGVSDVALFYVK